MQRGLSYRKAVCPSVCLSVKTKESSADILIPYERSVHLVFWHEEWLVGDVPFYMKFWAKLTPSPASKNGYFQSIFTRSASALTPSEKSEIITNRRSTIGFPMSLGWTAYVAPKPPKGLKNAKCPSFRRIKVDFFRRKSVTTFLCVKTFSSKVVRHSLAYLAAHKWLGDIASYLKFWAKSTNPSPLKKPTSNRYSLVLINHYSERKKVQLPNRTNRKTTTGFLINLRWTAYVASKPPPCSAVSLR